MSRRMSCSMTDLTDGCAGWVTGEAAAWPWCARCGLRADRHPGSPIADAVRRIVNGGRA